MKKVTVLIPCYNEAASIASVIRKFPGERLATYGYTLDFLVIDNNSADDTAQIARSAGARVLHEPKQGKGNAVRTGFRNISQDTDYVVMLDGDDSYRSEEILRLLEPLDSGFTKVVTGSRLQGRIRCGSMKSLNHFGNLVYSLLVRMGYRVKVSDTLSGYIAWSREVIDTLAPYLSAEDFTIEMEMVAKTARLGYEIYSVPISYEPRLGDSSLQPIADGLRILRTYAANLRWKPAEQYATTTLGHLHEQIPEAAVPNSFNLAETRTLHYRETEEHSARI